VDGKSGRPSALRLTEGAQVGRGGGSMGVPSSRATVFFSTTKASYNHDNKKQRKKNSEQANDATKCGV